MQLAGAEGPSGLCRRAADVIAEKALWGWCSFTGCVSEIVFFLYMWTRVDVPNPKPQIQGWWRALPWAGVGASTGSIRTGVGHRVGSAGPGAGQRAESSSLSPEPWPVFQDTDLADTLGTAPGVLGAPTWSPRVSSQRSWKPLPCPPVHLDLAWKRISAVPSSEATSVPLRDCRLRGWQNVEVDVVLLTECPAQDKGCLCTASGSVCPQPFADGETEAPDSKVHPAQRSQAGFEQSGLCARGNCCGGAV